MTDDEVKAELAIFDAIRLAHDIRHMLWENWGERAAPHLWSMDGESGVTARGPDGEEYRIIITKETH